MTEDKQSLPELRVTSGVTEALKPLVQLDLGGKVIAQLTPGNARKFAQSLVNCAEAADTDSFLVTFLFSEVGMPMAEAVDTMKGFRKWRAGGPEYDVPDGPSDNGKPQ